MGVDSLRRDMTERSAASQRRVDSWRTSDQGYNALAYLLAGPLLYGGLGWVADHFLGTGFLLPVGLVAGMGLAVYTVWLRYGTHADRSPGAEQAAPTDRPTASPTAPAATRTGTTHDSTIAPSGEEQL
ncbi:hypothetical protein GCM10028814_10990 [Angustibacter aerolatus]